MSFLLRPITDRLPSLWKTATVQTDRPSSQQSAALDLTAIFENTQNQAIGDNLPHCTTSNAILEETQEGEISFHSELTGTVIFSDEMTMRDWLAENAEVDIWKIWDLRGEHSSDFFMLQQMGRWGYDVLNKRELNDQLSEEYGVLWKEVDQETGQATYKRFHASIFGNSCEEVDFDRLAKIADGLISENDSNPSTSTPRDTRRTSWGQTITAAFFMGLFASAGRPWDPNSGENTLFAERLGPTAIKAASTFQTSIGPIIGMGVGGAMGGLPGAIIGGMIFLSRPVRTQPVCLQVLGTLETSENNRDFAVSGQGLTVTGNSNFRNIDTPSRTVERTMSTSATPRSAAAVDNDLYIGEGSNIQAYNNANKTYPVRGGACSTPNQVDSITPFGDRYLVAASGANVLRVDISTRNSPNVVATYVAPDWVHDVASFGNITIAAANSYGVIFLNATMQYLSHVDTPGTPLALAIIDSHLFVADAGQGVHDIPLTNLASPAIRRTYATGYAEGLGVSGDKNLLAVADNNQGTKFYRAADRDNLALEATYPTAGSSHRVAFSGDTVIIGEWNSVLHFLSWVCTSTSSSSSLLPSAPSNSSSSAASSDPSSSSSPVPSSDPSSSSSGAPSSGASAPPSVAPSSSPSAPSSNASFSGASHSNGTSPSEDSHKSSENDGPNLYFFIGVPAAIAFGAGFFSLLAYLLGRRRKEEEEMELDEVEGGSSRETTANFVDDDNYANFPRGTLPPPAPSDDTYANVPNGGLPLPPEEEEIV